MRPRILGENFETLVHPVDDGAYYQTTFACWRQLLAARATQVGVEPGTPAPSTSASDGVDSTGSANGETTTITADPLLDAWTAATGGDSDGPHEPDIPGRTPGDRGALGGLPTGTTASRPAPL